MPENKIEKTQREIDDLLNSVIGKINSMDNKKDVQEAAQDALNKIIAGVELSKLEKAGILTYLVHRRVQ